MTRQLNEQTAFVGSSLKLEIVLLLILFCTERFEQWTTILFRL